MTVNIKINRDRVAASVAKDKERSKGGGFKPYWQPKPGANIFRIWAFLRGTDGEGDFRRVIRVHFPTKGRPTICGFSTTRDGQQKKGMCDECDASDAAQQERIDAGMDEKEAYKAVGKMHARPRFVFVVSPLRTGGELVPDKDRTPRVFWASKTTGEKIVDMLLDPDQTPDLSAALGAEGVNVKIKYDPDADGADMYHPSLLNKDGSKPLPAAWQALAQVCDPFNDRSLEPAWFLAENPEAAKAETPTAAPAKAAPAPKAKAPVKDEDADTDSDSDSDEPVTAVLPQDEDDADAPAAGDTDILADAKARLKADGLDGEYDVEVMDDGTGLMAPCYYKKGSEDGSWDYPAVPAKRKAPPAKKAGEGTAAVKERGFKGRKGEASKAPPITSDRDADDVT